MASAHASMQALRSATSLGTDAAVLAYGQAHNPAWVHNLRANPRAHLEIRGGAREVTAEEATGQERERYLELASVVYPGYRVYVKRAAPRRIAVIRLIP